MGQGAEGIVTVGSLYRVSKAQFFKMLLSVQGLIVSMHMYVHTCVPELLYILVC